MKGWTGRILRVDLSREEIKVWNYDADLAIKFIGGRGFAIKILWDELEPGIDPLSPRNLLIIAAGPLTGLPMASSGKLTVAFKSPLTLGYGDGNIGGLAAVNLRRAGYDAIIIRGKAKEPVYLYVGREVRIEKADYLWGLTTFETERKLREIYGKKAGILCIGPAGESLVKYATIISQEGRSGGRPGAGAVMGSKNLKALVIEGGEGIEVADEIALMKVGLISFLELRRNPKYNFWMKQGTMATIRWSQGICVLPTMNFREGFFEFADRISGEVMERMLIGKRACPNCNMPCGNIVKDAEGKLVELDYENVAMLGSNIGIADLSRVAVLNRLADEYGIDTISLGNVIGFAMEASERNLIRERIEWGDFDRVRELIREIAFREDLGALLAEGTRKVSERIKGGSERWAMNIKGLEISAYDCHAAPAMALAYATSPIGAHHKDAWIIGWEVNVGRMDYSEAKVRKLIELQRIRGGIFESLVACRLPWIELGLNLERYIEALRAATGINFSLSMLFEVADRIYSLIRAFWIREYGGMWGKYMDYPPARWFEEPLSKGPLKGAKLDKKGFDYMLLKYYALRGWDERGVPRRSTLIKLDLAYVAEELSNYISLSP